MRLLTPSFFHSFIRSPHQPVNHPSNQLQFSWLSFFAICAKFSLPIKLVDHLNFNEVVPITFLNCIPHTQWPTWSFWDLSKISFDWINLQSLWVGWLVGWLNFRLLLGKHMCMNGCVIPNLMGYHWSLCPGNNKVLEKDNRVVHQQSLSKKSSILGVFVAFAFQEFGF